MKNIKIVFIDIDGTLTDKERQVSKNTLNSVNNLIKKGVEVVFSSGRGLNYVKKIASLFDGVRYAICSNGSHIYDMKDNKNLYIAEIDFDIAKKIWEDTNKKNYLTFVNTDKEVYLNRLVPNEFANTNILSDFDELKDEKIFQLISGFNDLDEMEKFEKELGKLDLQVSNFSKSFQSLDSVKKGSLLFDINRRGVSKGNAIEKLLKLLKLDKEDTMCFGDNLNDISMFKACNVKVAMGNANNELKLLANYITLSNEEDGVSDFIEKNF